jgi:uncharacterized Zn finger protein
MSWRRGRSSTYDRGGYGGFSSGPKPPPPTDGIKVGKVGKTWWGERWMAALREVLRGDDGRLSRGGTYARAGRVSALVVANSKVTAKVTGSRPTPYTIEVTFTQLSADAWNKVIAELAKRAEYTAELLSGAMPKEIDTAFRAAGTNLFPATRADLKAGCSCPDWGDPCKHVAAVHHVLGEAFEKDPFLIFELRGKTRDQVLSALRTARGTASPSPQPDVSKTKTPATRTSKAAPELAPTEAAKKTRSKTKAADPTPPQSEVAAVVWTKVSADDYDRVRAPLPALHFNFDAPTTHGALLRQLGLPTTWTEDTALADIASPIVSRAAEYARRLALIDAAPEPEAEPPTTPLAPEPPPPRLRKAPARR